MLNIIDTPHVRRLRVPEHEALEKVMWASGVLTPPPQVLRRKYPRLPDGVRVLAVRHDFCSKSFDFVLAHDSFPPVEPGMEIPLLDPWPEEYDAVMWGLPVDPAGSKRGRDLVRQDRRLREEIGTQLILADSAESLGPVKDAVVEAALRAMIRAGLLAPAYEGEGWDATPAGGSD